MPDPILDEIRRVRDELIKEHGGWIAIPDLSKQASLFVPLRSVV